MNERMQKLELEAITYADSKVPADNRYNDIYHSIVRGKFAELIVKECITIAKNWEDQLENANSLSDSNAVGIVAYRIARQFGVEE